jgi:hypothetical protein
VGEYWVGVIFFAYVWVGASNKVDTNALIDGLVGFHVQYHFSRLDMPS